MDDVLSVMHIAVILGTPLGFRNTHGKASDIINDGMHATCHQKLTG